MFSPQVFCWNEKNKIRNKKTHLIKIILSPVRRYLYKKNIGYAMLPIDKTELGTKITILARGDETEATVIKEPFVTGREKL